MLSRKTKHIKKGELRVIRVDRNALYELIGETILENSGSYFNLLQDNDAIIRFVFDNDFSGLTAYAMDYSQALGVELDLLDKYVEKSVNYTTDSFFYSDNKNKYVSINLPEKLSG